MTATPPPEIYDEVVAWINEKIIPLDGLTIRRPFRPGGDYQKEAENYGPNDVVIDNPPFSILASIQDFYTERGIRFFLFAPGLTLFSSPRPGVTYIVAHAELTYHNGAKVRTSFVTNMEGKNRILIAGDLHKRLMEVDRVSRKHSSKQLCRWDYPQQLITSARLGKIVERGVEIAIPFDECAFVRKLDNAPNGSAIFGGGYLISERAVAERAVAERAVAERAVAEYSLEQTVALSDREWAIVRGLGK